VIFKDDFAGNLIESNRYVVNDTFGTAEILQDGFSAEGGCLYLAGNNAQGALASIRTTNPLQFAKSKASEMQFRFRLLSDDAARVRVGFYYDSTNYLLFEASTENVGNVFSLLANQATTTKWVYSKTPVDCGWHTVKLRLLGTAMAGTCTIDGDETNKLIMVNGDMPTFDQYGLYAVGETRGSSGVGAGDQRGLIMSYWRATHER
jgi:hypothetical protein